MLVQCLHGHAACYTDRQCNHRYHATMQLTCGLLIRQHETCCRPESETHPHRGHPHVCRGTWTRHISVSTSPDTLCCSLLLISVPLMISGQVTLGLLTHVVPIRGTQCCESRKCAVVPQAVVSNCITSQERVTSSMDGWQLFRRKAINSRTYKTTMH